MNVVWGVFMAGVDAAGVWGGAVSRSPKGSDVQYIASSSQV